MFVTFATENAKRRGEACTTSKSSLRIICAKDIHKNNNSHATIRQIVTMKRRSQGSNSEITMVSSKIYQILPMSPTCSSFFEKLYMVFIFPHPLMIRRLALQHHCCGQHACCFYWTLMASLRKSRWFHQNWLFESFSVAPRHQDV